MQTSSKPTICSTYDSMKTINRHLLWVAVLCFALLVCAPRTPHAARNDTFYLKSFDVDIEVEASGELLVTETLNYVFTDRTSTNRLRRIPSALVDRITDVQVYENGHRLRTKTSDRKNQFWISWRHQRRAPGSRTFVLQYRAQGAVRINERHDQVVWPAVFDNRHARIEAGQVTIRVPAALAGEIQHFSHYGVATEARQVDARTVTFRPYRALQPDEGLTVKLYVPHGRLRTAPPAWQRGEEVAYRLPGLVGHIDTLMFIGLAIALPVIWVLAVTQRHQWEMERTARHGRAPRT
jgi:hypothetical protein